MVPSLAGAQTAGRAEASKFLDINGVKLHYLEWGARDSSPLLLLHPAPLNAHVWETFGPAMARHYRVVAPDARGFGDSQWSDAYSTDAFVEDIRALVTTLGLSGDCVRQLDGGTVGYSYAAFTRRMWID